MKKLKEIIGENKLLQDMINVAAGAALVIILVLFCIYPDNMALLAIITILSGFINILNGIRKYMVPAARMQGMVLVVIGMVIWAVGICVFT